MTRSTPKARWRQSWDHIAAILLICLLAMTSQHSHAAGIATCTGKFPNPVTDICWSCILPI
ncbi:MAG: hypothetical protein V4532_08810, partial [Pseudomonadota bacterium]